MSRGQWSPQADDDDETGEEWKANRAGADVPAPGYCYLGLGASLAAHLRTGGYLGAYTCDICQRDFARLSPERRRCPGCCRATGAPENGEVR